MNNTNKKLRKLPDLNAISLPPLLKTDFTSATYARMFVNPYCVICAFFLDKSRVIMYNNLIELDFLCLGIPNPTLKTSSKDLSVWKKQSVFRKFLPQWCSART